MGGKKLIQIDALFQTDNTSLKEGQVLSHDDFAGLGTREIP